MLSQILLFRIMTQFKRKETNIGITAHGHVAEHFFSLTYFIHKYIDNIKTKRLTHNEIESEIIVTIQTAHEIF